ncbi:homoserine kinase [Chroococcus sp. FPU101]|uniref:homoserine kinase n=1 Tax=Chroococcus sp. FPU101 TaxID=1974212 RepID=UPI001A8E8571|nr:homoserine kinase [Chroococcus sp. FPU101]GFE68468.1 homoserine kinase [Chroococcus sp. FPU101]
MTSVTVTVPATTANIGPGFDCLGAALTLYNEFTFTTVDSQTPLEIIVRGDEAAKVGTDKDNLLYQAFLRLYHHAGLTPPPVKIEIGLKVPLARGLGSSATAIVGGLVGANELAGKPFSQNDVMELAIAIEGHPDNVVPALLGKCQLSVGEAGNWQICEIPWHDDIVPIVAIPDFELSTEAARAVLPKEYSRQDAIFNVAHMGLLIRGLETGNGNWLSKAMDDMIHQPYRLTLIKGYDAVKLAALASGAYNVVISGAGPTLLALAYRQQAEYVVTAMRETWMMEDVEADVQILSLDQMGTKVIY